MSPSEEQSQASLPVVVYLGLGANLGPRAETVAAAVHALGAGGVLRHTRLSPLYETDAVTADPQPPYLNAVVRGETFLSAVDLLTACLNIEASLGRTRPPDQDKAARVIDIDLLLYGAAIIDTPALQVPHPAMLERPFVLIPLADVAARGLKHPVGGVDLTVTRASPAVRALVPAGGAV